MQKEEAKNPFAYGYICNVSSTRYCIRIYIVLNKPYLRVLHTYVQHYDRFSHNWCDDFGSDRVHITELFLDQKLRNIRMRIQFTTVHLARDVMIPIRETTDKSLIAECTLSSYVVSFSALNKLLANPYVESSVSYSLLSYISHKLLKYINDIDDVSDDELRIKFMVDTFMVKITLIADLLDKYSPIDARNGSHMRHEARAILSDIYHVTNSPNTCNQIVEYDPDMRKLFHGDDDVTYIA